MTAVPELIAAELVTRLEAITTGNGYFTNVASVDRVPRDAAGWTPKNLSIAVAQLDDQYNESQSHEGNPPAVAYDLTFNIHCFVRPASGSTTTPDTTTNAMVQAVRKAVTAPDQWYTFDDNAVIADFGTVSPYVSSTGDHSGATVPLIVTYRISETDPETSRA